MRDVYINRLSKFLPNEAVSNDEMEHVLGKIDNRASRVKRIILRQNGIKSRYYALRNGKSTHTNAQMTANAINALFTGSDLSIKDIDVLAVGTSTPDQLIPSHAVMVHGELGNHPIEVVSTTGVCCCSVQAMKYAYMNIASGFSDNAVCAGSERVSTWLEASRYQKEADKLHEIEANPIIAFEKDFLRWMLSDGASAALLQDKPNFGSVSLKIEWLEITSFAHELNTCMYAGATQNEDGSLSGWSDHSTEEWTEQSIFSLKQDTRLLGENIVKKGGEFLSRLMEKHQLRSEQIDYLLPHMSSNYFKQQIYDSLIEIGLPITWEKWFFNLPEVGNVGSASPYLMLEELMSSGKLRKGEKVLVMIPESARFTYAYLYLTVV